MANLVLALLAFGLVSSVGAGVALHQIGSQPLVVPHNGEACGHDHNETNDPDETAERNETGDRNGTPETKETGDANETADHASTPGLGEIRDHNETGDHDTETAEHDDNGACEPNEVGDHQDMSDSDSNETKDED